jgi:hypothetical protein
MGIDCAIINSWLPKNIDTEAVPWSTLTFKPLIMPRSRNECVFLDLSERMRKVSAYFKHARKTNLASISDMCEYFYQLIVRNAKDRFGAVVLLDNKQHVPPEKKEEQLDRKESSQSQGLYPYPFDYKLLDHIPGQLIDPDRLSISNNDLLQDFIAHLIAYMVSKQPYNETIIIDCRSTDPPTHLIAQSTNHRQEPTWRNEIGESEMRIFWWLQTLHRAFPFVAPSIIPIIAMKDTDAMPLSLQYLMYLEYDLKQPLPQNILWVKDETNDVYKTIENPIRGLDLVVFYRALQDGHVNVFRHLRDRKHRVEAFVMGCLLCSCDYYKKKLLTHKFGPEPILEAAYYTYRSEPPSTVDQRMVMRFIYSIYAVKVMKANELVQYKNRPHQWILENAYKSLQTYIEEDPEDSSRTEEQKREQERQKELRLYDQAIEWLIPQYGKGYILPNSQALIAATKKITFTESYWRSTFRQPHPPLPPSSPSIHSVQTEPENGSPVPLAPSEPTPTHPPSSISHANNIETIHDTERVHTTPSTHIHVLTLSDNLPALEREPPRKKHKPLVSLAERALAILPPPLT